MSAEYIKPINKTTLTVEFRYFDANGDFRQKMELPRVPERGEYFFDINLQGKIKITEVIYQPYNQFEPDVVIQGEFVRP